MLSPPINRRLDIPGQPPGEDAMLAMVAALASELAIVRERLDTVERLVEQAGVFIQAEIDAYTPPPDALAARDGMRKRIIAKIFRPLHDAARRAAASAQG